ncbi:endopeptidase La [[Clostridium] aminophilum]|uniref:Lon protease n=1 Tax=[Clostridium] aminophilum TaxID=1526 RepID=A0A1I6IR12_9FIRM|nr:endopeptidase La [[Clostridium] aminophilum]SFR69174.1 ATP-dependent Lon protease [[Clostridium] aminophilum]
MAKSKKTIPMIALRGLTLLPGMKSTFDCVTEKSVSALAAAMAEDRNVFLVSQMDEDAVDPLQDDLFSRGVIAHIHQYMKAADNLARVTVECGPIAELLNMTDDGKCFRAEIERIDHVTDDLPAESKPAMFRVLRDQLRELHRFAGETVYETVDELLKIRKLEVLMEKLPTELPWNWEARQSVLESATLSEVFQVEMQILIMETQADQIRHTFQEKVQERIDKHQKEYVLHEQLAEIREELGERSDPETDADEMRKKVDELVASDEIKEKIRKEINRFENMPIGSQDTNVLRTYLETVLELPWDKRTEDNIDLSHAREVLEKDHYGLEKVKDRVLEALAVRILTGEGNGQIICLVGPPGTGKTSIARSIARALGRKYVRISLGGVHDEAEIRGHRKTYVGAMPGRLVEALHQAQVSNPLMLLDEIDKVSSDYRGDTGAALLEVLDTEQNSHFRDHYVEMPIDLSHVMFIATANNKSTIPLPLLDRMDIIEVSSYTENEKYHIAKDYLIPKQLERNGLKKSQLTIQAAGLRRIIHNYTREAGVRNLERRIGDICRKTARQILEKDEVKVRVTEKNLEKYLGPERNPEEDRNRVDQAGIVTGLAWTSVGGVTLQIEVNTMPGKGQLILTGQMGDVMKESARIALTWVRSVATDYQVPEDWFDRHDIHIHIPEGAVPKDGPSAGITMSTAMLSAVSGRKVRADLAMTGEVTLRGQVLMIGGLKEKLLAAKQADIHTVLVPARNQPDVEELSEEITDGLEILYVEEMNDVVRRAFCPSAPEKSAKASETSKTAKKTAKKTAAADTEKAAKTAKTAKETNVSKNAPKADAASGERPEKVTKTPGTANAEQTSGKTDSGSRETVTGKRAKK